MSRPTIPADVRRRVLLEAGHRCAIHTCLHPEVDVHHIVPWNQSQDHAFENLIALCPNCHRRADAGEIDRQSLLAYKARLRARFHFEGATGPEAFVRKGWSEASLAEEREENPRYGVHLEYPRLTSESAYISELNEIIHSLLLRKLHEFRSWVLLQGPALFENWGPSNPAHLAASFDVALFTGKVVSIRFSFASYTWGAHGSHWTEVLNYLINPACDLSLDTVFKDSTRGIKALSDFCIQALSSEEISPGVRRDEAWIRRGAGPKGENFERFNITPYGLLISFDEYQVGAYAEGPSQVLVPLNQIGDLIADGILGSLVI